MGTNSRPTHRNKRNETKNCMKSKTATLGILLLFTSRLLWAQAPPVYPLAENLFPPELVMQYPLEIGLTEDQRKGLMAEIQKEHERFSDLQQRFQKKMEALAAFRKMKFSKSQ